MEEKSQEGFTGDYHPAVEKMTWKERLLNKDCSTFNKYIGSTTAHGVVRIFTSKSIIRRLFWLFIVLAAAGGCLYNIIDRISYLVSNPTSTSISITRTHAGELAFPAVTVCNLNFFRTDVLQEKNLSELVQSAFFLNSDLFGVELCEDLIENVSRSQTGLHDINYEYVAYEARNHLETLILECHFAGKRCNIIESFQPVFTRLGICYTFNYGNTVQRAGGTGQREGLQLIINVDQASYSTPSDAGIKVAIHPQSEPPLPDDQGIGVPVGRNAFISIREKTIVDKTGSKCTPSNDVTHLNFLQGEYTAYSESACFLDCYQTNLADHCQCLAAKTFYSPDSSKYEKLPNCTLGNICCVVEEFLSPSSCDCPAACSSVSYESSVSYSYFPAEYQSIKLANIFNVTPDVFPNNHLAISVYFETLNIETQTTNNAYSFVALLSDIGGQLGLFLGVSVISIMEFGTWIMDEIKNRVFGMSEKKTKEMCCCCCRRHYSQEMELSTSDESETSNGKQLDTIT